MRLNGFPARLVNGGLTYCVGGKTEFTVDVLSPFALTSTLAVGLHPGADNSSYFDVGVSDFVTLEEGTADIRLLSNSPPRPGAAAGEPNLDTILYLELELLVVMVDVGAVAVDCIVNVINDGCSTRASVTVFVEMVLSNRLIGATAAKEPESMCHTEIMVTWCNE